MRLQPTDEEIACIAQPEYWLGGWCI